MKKITLSLLSLTLLLLPCLANGVVSYVNPFIGTDKMGHTFPGACVPFGFVQLSPDTDTIPHNINGIYQKEVYKYCAGYQYEDETIVGFSHTHFNGTGHSDLGDVLIMPTVGPIRLNPGTRENPDFGYRSRFDHEQEQASPGYYKVLLKDYGIEAEMTATERVGVHRYSYPKGEGNMIIDLNHSIYNYEGKALWASLNVVNDTLLTGFRMTSGWARYNQVYFAISLSKPIVRYGGKDVSERSVYKGFWKKFDTENNFPEMAGRSLKSFFVFDFEDGAPLVVKVALSAVSTEGALRNLNEEAMSKSFDAIKAEATSKWEEALSSIKIKGEDNVKRNFFTALYHSMINPSLYEDVDGQYRGVDNNIHKTRKDGNFTVFSLWDTFRALHPLFNVICPDRSSGMMASLLNHYGQSVHHALPVWSHFGNENWCMTGYHSVSLLSDGLAKGISLDKDAAINAMIRSSNIPYYDGISYYKDFGFVPFDYNQNSASITLEYAYDDWAIYKAAERSGADNSLVEEYRGRANNYRWLYDGNGYVRPRYANGEWKEDLDVYSTSNQGFIEGNSLNYSFFVPHDVKGMIRCMGGEEMFLNKLDNLFDSEMPSSSYVGTEDVTKEGVIGCYVHGNEPSHHIPYLYMWTSQPWKTAERVRNVLETMYKNRPDGLCGNEDCGQMSAWYVFSSIGLYPVCPGTDQYVLGAPIVSEAEINLENGKVFKIETDNLSEKNKYVKEIYLNGERYKKTFIVHNDVLSGGVLRFVMSSKPNKDAFDLSQKPYSLSDEKTSRIVPAVCEEKLENGALLIGSEVTCSYDSGLGNEAAFLSRTLKEEYNISLKQVACGGTVKLALEDGRKDLFAEGAYSLVVGNDIKITAASSAGIFYGLQTLRQLLTKEESEWSVPKTIIADKPHFQWRAFMLDEARAFKGKKVVMSLLDEMAALKMNVFHWHLTDDQGWRIEIPKYPKLTEIGAWRDSTQIGGYKGSTYDGTRSGGFYTQNEIKEIVRYAKSLHIDVVPEFELPGHESAAIAAYSWLGTTKREIKVPCNFGVKYDVIDVSSQEVFNFISDVLDEIISLFPSEIIHIGGDEVKYDQWKQSADIISYMQKNRIPTPADLQVRFTNKISYILKGKGRRMMGWNDIMGSKIHDYNESEDTGVTESLADGTIIQFWKGDTDLIKSAASGGYDVVNSYHYYTYLDYDYSKITLKKAYGFNPVPDDFPMELQSKIIGMGCQMWGEEIMDDEKMFRMIFPRLAAYAETCWSTQSLKNFDEFYVAMGPLLDRWRIKGYLR